MKDPIKSQSDEPIRIPYFDWDKAKHFYFVVKLGGVTNAAKHLHITQPAVTRKIQDLEDRLNFKLLTRTPTGIKVTRKGEDLFAIVERTFLELKGLSYNAAVTANNGQKRRIRIVTTHALASYVFCDLILEYGEKNPHIIFELIGDDHSLDIILNDVDIAIRPINKNIRDTSEQGVQKEYLFSSVKRLYASEEYLKKYGEPKTIDDLKKHKLLAFAQPEKHPYAQVNWILTLGMPEGKSHEPTFTSNSVECLVEAAKKGYGIYGSYAEFKIIKSSGLKNILHNVTDEEIKDYFIYPDYLKNDKDIINFKNYLIDKLSK